MPKIPAYFFLIALGLVLFCCWISASGTKDAELIGGIFMLYSGVILLVLGRKEKDKTFFGMRFRMLIISAAALFIEIYSVFKFITKH
jgi:uncharacterized membrane protein